MRRAALGVLFALMGFAGSAGAQDEAGRAAYDRHCVHCHGPGAEAVGTMQLARTRGDSFALLTERDDLVAPYIEFVVRNGLRSMPGFVPSDLTEGQLDALVEYLTGDASAR